MSSPGAHLYFIQSGDTGPVKIGRSNDALSRLCALQTSSPVRLQLLGVVSDGGYAENKLHRHFKALRLVGEWFDATPELLDAITRLIERQGGFEEFEHRKVRFESSKPAKQQLMELMYPGDLCADVGHLSSAGMSWRDIAERVSAECDYDISYQSLHTWYCAKTVAA